MIWQAYPGSDGWFVARETYEGLRAYPAEPMPRVAAERLATRLNAKESDREVGKDEPKDPPILGSDLEGIRF